jgi:hypothetical protein
LNQVEICGSIPVPRLLQWASFPAVTELRQRLFASIESVNTTLAKPFNWTDMGRPLAAETSIELAPSCTRGHRLELRDEGGNPRLIMRDRPALPRRTHGNIELGLGHLHPDKALGR